MTRALTLDSFAYGVRAPHIRNNSQNWLYPLGGFEVDNTTYGLD